MNGWTVGYLIMMYQMQWLFSVMTYERMIKSDELKNDLRESGIGLF
jgi:hypothetical protein